MVDGGLIFLCEMRTTEKRLGGSTKAERNTKIEKRLHDIDTIAAISANGDMIEWV